MIWQKPSKIQDYKKELGLINADEGVYERMADEIDFLGISKKELRQRVERYLKKHSEEER